MFLKGKNIFLSMNYGRIISAGYSWFSLRKTIWFLIFFWVSLPVVILLPSLIEKYSVFPKSFSFFAYAMYAFMYLMLIIAFIVLTQEALSRKNAFVERFSIRKFVDVVFLVFVELFYVLFWNLHRSFRRIQLLLLFASALLLYYFSVVQAGAVLDLFALCATAYFILVVYNCIRVFFSTTIFCSGGIGIKSAVKESGAITHNKVFDTIAGIATAIIAALFLFLFLVIILGSLTSLVLNFSFIRPIAVSIGFQAAALFALAPSVVVYHFAIGELFAQLSVHHDLSTRIKGILAHHILHPKRVVSKSPARKLVKKKKRK
jgi:hypothetical protein